MTEGYRAAAEGAAMVERPDRVLRLVTGRAPGRMMTGIATGTMPPDPEDLGGGLRGGRSFYSAVLTPKGKMVTDLRIFRLEPGEEGVLLLDLPAAGDAPATAHFAKYLPPRFARIEEQDGALGMLTVVGPDAASHLAGAVPGLPDAGALGLLEEGEERVLGQGPPPAVRVVRNGDAVPPAFDILAARDRLAAIAERLGEAGAVRGDAALLEILRIERGRPAFGVEMDGDTLPPEAGIADRAIDHTKGCYTGQEVIVRIRDRGRVNRKLRGLLFGELPAPEAGAPIFVEGRDRAAGEVRSAARSPRFGQGAGLGYVRRELEVPGTARLGSPDGPPVEVRALDPEGWVLSDGDPGRD